GTIDQTLFIKKQKGHILLVQIYVDDIIFGATNKDLCRSFEKLMKDKFQMSSMGELIFFLGLQVKQKEDGIFISQDKYVTEILIKFGLTEGKSASTPIDIEKPLLKDPDGAMDSESTAGLWFILMLFSDIYPLDSILGFELTLQISVDQKSTSGICTFVGCCLTSWFLKKKTALAISTTEAEYVSAEKAWCLRLYDDDDGNDKGTSHASTLSPTRFVNSLTNDVPQVFQNPHNNDPHMEPFYTYQTKIINRQVQIRDEHRGGLRLIGKGLKNLWRNMKNDDNVTTTPSSITTSSSPSSLNAPSKTASTKDTLSTFGTTSSLFESKPQASPPTSSDTPSAQPSNPFLENIMDAPPRPSHPLPLQSHPSLDITLSLSPITPLDHIFDTPSPPSPQPPPQPPLMGHPIYFNYHDYHGSTFLCCFHNRNLIFSLRDEMNLMFAHIEYLLTSTMNSLSSPHP
nr:copia protein [Tanacetum cinerariifolium]